MSSISFVAGTSNVFDGITTGTIVLFDQSDLAEFIYPKNVDELAKEHKMNTKFINNTTTVLCLLLVPSFMIPTEIIHFFSSSLEKINSIRIFAHRNDSEKYMAILCVNSPLLASEIIRDYNSQLLSSLDRTYCLLFPVKDILFNIAIDNNGDDFEDLKNAIQITNNDYFATEYKENYEKEEEENVESKLIINLEKKQDSIILNEENVLIKFFIFFKIIFLKFYFLVINYLINNYYFILN
jgi:hypothetical protein